MIIQWSLWIATSDRPVRPGAPRGNTSSRLARNREAVGARGVLDIAGNATVATVAFLAVLGVTVIFVAAAHVTRARAVARQGVGSILRRGGPAT
jgi:hypothetical protein